MNASDQASRTSISAAETIEEIGDFWDTHSLADYWDQTEEVQIDVRVRRRRRVTLDPDLYTEIEGLARRRGIRPETLINLWLAERIGQTAELEST